MDQPALHALSGRRYVYAEWKVVRAGVDYHVEVGAHYYPEPSRHARTELNVRVSKTTVALFQRGQRVSSHVDCSKDGTL